MRSRNTTSGYDLVITFCDYIYDYGEGVTVALGDVVALGEVVARGEAVALADGATDPLRGDAEGEAEDDAVAEGEATNDGDGSIVGITVANGDGVASTVDWNLFRNQTK